MRDGVGGSSPLRSGAVIAAPVTGLPRAASVRFGARVFIMLALIITLFGLSDYVLYNRAFGNPLMVFCLLCSLTAFTTAAIFPSDMHVSRPVIAAGMVTWSILCFRILAYEWDMRPSEPEIRTMLRRAVCSIWSTLTFLTTLAYVADLLASSWFAIRAQFVVAAVTDLFHTAAIHMLYYTHPESQPKVPIQHTSGARIGPPPFGAYAPCLYILLMVYLLRAEVREVLSRWTGATQLSIALGQVRRRRTTQRPLPPPHALSQRCVARRRLAL